MSTKDTQSLRSRHDFGVVLVGKLDLNPHFIPRPLVVLIGAYHGGVFDCDKSNYRIPSPQRENLPAHQARSLPLWPGRERARQRRRRQNERRHRAANRRRSRRTASRKARAQPPSARSRLPTAGSAVPTPTVRRTIPPRPLRPPGLHASPLRQRATKQTASWRRGRRERGGGWRGGKEMSTTWRNWRTFRRLWFVGFF